MALQQDPYVDRERHLDEVLAEYLEALEAGRAPPAAELLDRHADLAQDLRAFLDDQERFASLVAPLCAGALVPGEMPRRSAGTPVPSGPFAFDCDNPGGNLPSLADYELLEEIGRGGMGVVYKARHRRLNRVVALKTILAGRLATPAEMRRFHLEAENVAALDHPNIVPIYEVGAHDGLPYFAMRLVSGGDLCHRPERWRDQPRAAARLLAVVARAIDHAHRHGILHRDLKPSNVLLDTADEPHVTDFGLARRMEDDKGQTPSGLVAGTPAYMAPEQALGRPNALTTAADVYSLGAILYTLLTGRPPFKAETPLDTLLEALEREPPRPRNLVPALDRDLELVCLKCLQKSPGQRYTSAAALADDLERYLNGEPILARAVSRAERAWRWCRRRPAIASLAGALLVASVAGVGLVGWQWRRAETNFQAAREHLEALERERARVEEHFHLAHQAVNDLTTRLGEARLRQTPGSQPLRRELLEAALGYYQRFLRERGDDTALKAELADTHFRIGNILSEMGPRADAAAAYRQALEVYEELLLGNPERRAWQLARARVGNHLGLILAATAQPQAAEDAYRQANAVLRILHEAAPTDRDVRLSWATLCNNLGLLQRQVGRQSEARTSFAKGIDLLEGLASASSEPSQAHAALSALSTNLGSLHAAAGRRQDALEQFQRARALTELVARADPKNQSHQNESAQRCVQEAGELCSNNRFADALPPLERARSILDKLDEANPTVARYRSDLADANRQTGHAYRGLRQLDKARESYRRALQLDEELAQRHPDVTEFTNNLAKCHFDLGTIPGPAGQHDEALNSFQTAADLREKLVVANPDLLSLRHDLGLTWSNIGTGLSNTGRHERAANAYRRGIAHVRVACERAPAVVAHGSLLAGLLRGLAAAERRAGKFAAAAAATTERQQLWPENAQEQYQAAREFAQLISGLDRDRAKPSREQQEQRQRYGDQAMGALRSAVAAGWRDAERLRQEHELEPLRMRDDFLQLLAQLAAKQP